MQSQANALLTKQYDVKLQNFKDNNKLGNKGKWKLDKTQNK